MLTLRRFGPNDYSVHDAGRYVGRIRYASERSPGIWLWHVTVTIPGPPFGDAKTIEEAKQRFKGAWRAFKEKHGAEALAKAYSEMDHANRPDRYRRGLQNVNSKA
jgi:hypothetical protein